MKHVLKILFILLFFLFITSLFEDKINITSKSIFDAKVSYGNVGVSIRVDTEPPEIYIASPTVNSSYTVNTIPLKFTILDDISSIDSIWYNLDNGTNTTITGNTTFTADQGTHTLYIFAKDSVGLVNDTESVSFTILTAIPTGEATGIPSQLRPGKITLPQPIHKPGKLFDINIEIPTMYRSLTQGEEIIAEITLINTQQIGLVDVRIDYYIKDLNDKTIYHKYETKGVENQITFIKKLDTSNIKPGTYMYIIKTNYKDDIAVAGYPITISEKTHIEQPTSFISKDFITYTIIAILITFTLALYLQYKKIKKLGIKKISEEELKKRGYIKKRR